VLGPGGCKLTLQLAIQPELYSNYPVGCKEVFLHNTPQPPTRAPRPREKRDMRIHLTHPLRQRRLPRLHPLAPLRSPKLVEMGGLSGGFDAVWFDQEHAGLTIAQLEDAGRAARASGLDCFVRLTATDYATVMRALETGAGGVMAAMVRSVAQVEDLVRWAKFHPRGGRGVNGSGGDGRYGTLPPLGYFKKANADTVVGGQIEHIHAVQQIER